MIQSVPVYIAICQLQATTAVKDRQVVSQTN